MNSEKQDQIYQIYEKWHEYAKAREVENLINLYDDNAVFESPLVSAILNKDQGLLKGRNEILEFFLEVIKKKPNDLARWYRTGRFFTDGKILFWEYLREIPGNNQIEILELMELKNGKIINHRTYWDWFGTQISQNSAVYKLRKEITDKEEKVLSTNEIVFEWD